MLELRQTQQANRAAVDYMKYLNEFGELAAVRKLAIATFGADRANVYVDLCPMVLSGPISTRCPNYGNFCVGYFHNAEDGGLPVYRRPQEVIAVGRGHREIQEQLTLWKKTN